MTEYLSTKEVADRLHVSLSTVKRWIRDGKLTPCDLNAGQTQRRLLRISEAEIEAFTRRGESPSRDRQRMPRRPRQLSSEQYL